MNTNNHTADNRNTFRKMDGRRDNKRFRRKTEEEEEEEEEEEAVEEKMKRE